MGSDDLDIKIEFAEIAGRPEPIAVTIRSTGAPLTRGAIRAIPFGHLIAEERHQRSGSPDEAAPLPSLGAQRGRAVDHEQLATVADIYRGARRFGTPVVRAVAHACSISESAAAKRIRLARDAGLLAES